MAIPRFRTVLVFLVAVFATLAVSAQPFVETVKTGDVKRVKSMLKKKTTNVNEADAEGLTALMVATIANDSAMTVLLLESGANPNLQSKSGMSALHAAAFNNRDGIVQVLLFYRADPNLVDGKGRTPVMVAAQMGHTNQITHLAQAGAALEVRDVRGNTPLMLACGGRHLGAMDELLERGANPNCRDLQGRTPLMLLALLGEDEMVRILLKSKADVTLVDHSMKTALAYAREYKRKAVIALLERAGAKF